jgi:hypothetical protein
VRRAGRESRCARARPPHGGAPHLPPRRPRRGAQLAVAGAVPVSSPNPGLPGPPRSNQDGQMWVTALGGWDAPETVCRNSVACASRPRCVETFFLGDVFGWTVFLGAPLDVRHAAREAPRCCRHSDLNFSPFVQNPAGLPPIACPWGTLPVPGAACCTASRCRGPCRLAFAQRRSPATFRICAFFARRALLVPSRAFKRAALSLCEHQPLNL